MYCQVTTSVLWALQRCLPSLHTLVIKDDGLGGVGSSGLAVIASLTQLVMLGVTVAPGSDVGVLKDMDRLRWVGVDEHDCTAQLLAECICKCKLLVRCCRNDIHML